MIDHLDNLLRHLFVSRIDEITADNQVGFQPPDSDWLTHVGSLAANALNVYLVGIAENFSLRSNERRREFTNGLVREAPAPRRLECQYFVTAWSPVAFSPLVEPSPDEHALLYKAAAALMNAEPIVPRQVYEPDPLPAGFPAVIADAELPTVVLPADGFSKMAEFWGTVEGRWRPGLYFTVTLPVILDTRISGPMVTTRITEYRQTGGGVPGEIWIQIGGHVRTGTPPVPVDRAWVRLETSPGGLPLQTAETGPDGRFTFAGLAAGPYTLRVRAEGVSEQTFPIEVPSPAGGYDVELV
ncbi:MAG TPA: Pvc16 family protein [Thermoanaerobaculia bacterium]|nr:Pvc16 family protein [Thermoanaerobaculia bacterium]